MFATGDDFVGIHRIPSKSPLVARFGWRFEAVQVECVASISSAAKS